jgi:Mg-chelatase subunit ChlI
MEKRLSINKQDILLAAELALPHRLRRTPFQLSKVDPEDLRDQLKEILFPKTTAKIRMSWLMLWSLMIIWFPRS